MSPRTPLGRLPRIPRPTRLLVLAMLAATATLATPTSPAAAAGVVVADTSVGTAAPPPTLGGFTMTPVTTDPRPSRATVTTIPTPLGDIALDGPAFILRANELNGGWSNHPYAGTTYVDADGSSSMLLTLPADTGAFYLYAMGDTFGTRTITATAEDGTVVAAQQVTTPAGATYFGFYAPNSVTDLTSVRVQSANGAGLLVGELGIARQANATLTPADATTTPGVPVAYQITVPAPVGVTTTPDSLEISPDGAGTGASCTATACSATRAGTYTVIGTWIDPATDDPYFAFTTLTVVAGPTTAVSITPQGATTPVGTAVTYQVTATDTFGNVTSEPATVTATPTGGGAPTACPALTCNPATPGDYTVAATVGAVTTATSLSVIANSTTMALSTVGTPTFGDDITPEATLTSPSGSPTGTVQFAVDGSNVGTPVTVDAAGVATGAPVTGLGAGTYTLSATFTSDPAGVFETATAELVFVVAQAPTATLLAVTDDSLSATVTSASGVPTGDVRFEIDGKVVATVALTGGAADYTGDTTGGEDSAVTATYLGSADHLSSADSTARLDPTVTANVPAPNAAGWYDAPVEVTFTCAPGSAPVPCPAPVTITTEGAGQTVTRTVVADDGGIAVVTSAPVSIDLSAPTAAVRGVKAGATYRIDSPGVGCLGGDALSGVATCTVAVNGTAPGPLVATATVTDLAGNTTAARVAYRVVDVWVTRSSYVAGAWQVPIGERRLLTVATRGRPSLTRLNGTPIAPARFAGRIRGEGVWTFAVRFKPSTRVGRVLVTRLTTTDGARTVRLRAVR